MSPLIKGEFKGGVFSEGNAKVVHVHPTSRWLFKCWRDEYMAAVINWLTDRGITVIVTSAPDKREMEKAKKILSIGQNFRGLSQIYGRSRRIGTVPATELWSSS